MLRPPSPYVYFYEGRVWWERALRWDLETRLIIINLKSLMSRMNRIPLQVSHEPILTPTIFTSNAHIIDMIATAATQDWVKMAQARLRASSPPERNPTHTTGAKNVSATTSQKAVTWPSIGGWPFLWWACIVYLYWHGYARSSAV